MDIVAVNRIEGKTELAITRSARTGAVIVVNGNAMVKHIKDRAKRKGIDIPEPITYRKLKNGYSKGRDETYILENLDIVIYDDFKIRPKEIELITLSKNY